jgi:hypothetical protein
MIALELEELVPLPPLLLLFPSRSASEEAYGREDTWSWLWVLYPTGVWERPRPPGESDRMRIDADGCGLSFFTSRGRGECWACTYGRAGVGLWMLLLTSGTSGWGCWAGDFELAGGGTLFKLVELDEGMR